MGGSPRPGDLLRYLERRPDPGCLTAQALTTPYQAVAIARADATPRSQREVVSVPC